MLSKTRAGLLLPFLIKFSGLILVASLAITLSCGGSTTTKVTPPLATIFAYTANQNTSNISGYSLNPTNGTLTPLAGFPVPSGVNPNFMIHDPLGHFLLVTDTSANKLRVYAISSTTGMLTEVAPSPYTVSQEPRALAMDPTGKFVYVASMSVNSVDAFSINSSGVLTLVPGSPFPNNSTGFNFGSSIVVDHTGKFVYLLDDSKLYVFSINNSNGALTLLHTVAGPEDGTGLALDPSGSFLYAVGAGAADIESYVIDSTGAITPSSPSPMVLHDGSFTISIDPSGKFAYTVEAGSILAAYSVHNGTFTSLNTGYAGALGSQQLAIDQSGKFLYAPQTGTANDISGFRIDSSGTLSGLAGSPTPSGDAPLSMTIVSQ